MILVAYGTRPEIIKLFPVIRELGKRRILHETLFTGQQTDLYEDVKELVPPPGVSFAGSFSGKGKHNTLGESFIKICLASEKLFARRRFDAVVVQGDTTTAWALAQMAFYNGVKVAHVEAGLRTFDPHNPYPEEMNRTLIGGVAEWNFAPTKRASENLLGFGARNVHNVGNTIVDAVKAIRRARKIPVSRSNVVPVTLHRRENHAIMGLIFDELNRVAAGNPDLDLVLPIHPNPNVRKHRPRLTAGNIRVIPPVGYFEMLRMLASARFVISDSGGIQEECACLNKRILVVRETTERPEVIEMGLGRLVGRKLLPHIEWARKPAGNSRLRPFGDGRAAERIVRILSRSL
ncbi:MAG: UDP-N-acetylglucosamine 2-epimerase (non-hydrolyzing) [Deltaproteobacteria bacterium]|nr:UDP-N-acetylglucosamine 2-epimerase (non-hydrolyzing) [Deltaproteobacteria bacterium]